MRAIVMFVMVLMISVFFAVKHSAAGHSGKHLGLLQQKASDLPLGKRHSRPKLSLERALGIAQTLVQKRHSDSSSYWLFYAHFILYGGSNIPDEEKTPGITDYCFFRRLRKSGSTQTLFTWPGFNLTVVISKG